MNTPPEEPSQEPPVRVAVVDDHSIMRAVFSAIVEDAPDLDLAWSAANLAEARPFLDSEEPGLLILDVSLPDGNGFEFTREVLARHPGLRILIVSAEEDETFKQRARACGARGFLSKNVSPDEVLRAVHTIRAEAA
jgi:DNA-binding NarL/FixJ family response regulator